MTAPGGYQTFPLPANLPTATRCIQLQLPDDPDFFKLFYGQLDQLTQWFSYDRDTAKTGRLVAAYWKQVIRSIQFCPPPELLGPGFSVGEDMQIKQDPDNPCLVREVCPDGSLGCVVIDMNLCFPNPAPGGGTVPPLAGKCQEYKLNFQANALTPLPFLVNSGDTLTLSTLEGAGSDGTLHYYCPDGEHFIGGACAGGEFTQSTDPLPAKPHMSIVLLIGSTYYSWYSGVFTIPSGVVNQAIYIGVNDSPIADNNGTYALDFNYCNNVTPPATPWCNLLDFTISPFGFAPDYFTNTGACGSPTQTWGQWVSGIGLQGSGTEQLDCSSGASVGRFDIDLGAVTNITASEFKGSISLAHPSNIAFVIGSNDPTFSTGNVVLNNPNVTAGGSFDDVASLAINVRYLRLEVTGLGGSGPTGVTAQSSSLKLKGTGPNPFGTSDC